MDVDIAVPPASMNRSIESLVADIVRYYPHIKDEDDIVLIGQDNRYTINTGILLFNVRARVTQQPLLKLDYFALRHPVLQFLFDSMKYYTLEHDSEWSYDQTNFQMAVADLASHYCVGNATTHYNTTQCKKWSGDPNRCFGQTMASFGLPRNARTFGPIIILPLNVSYLRMQYHGKYGVDDFFYHSHKTPYFAK